MVRQNSHVEHVRVRENDVGPLADLPATIRRGVAVVDRGADVRGVQLRERARLVLRQRLRGVEVERPGLRFTGDRVQHRQVEAERLPGCRARGQDHVLAAPGCVPGCALVEVELG